MLLLRLIDVSPSVVVVAPLYIPLVSSSHTPRIIITTHHHHQTLVKARYVTSTTTTIGTGKSMLCRAIAQAAGAHVFVVNGPDVLTGLLGDSEAGIRGVLDV